MKWVRLFICIALMCISPVYGADRKVADWRQKLFDASVPDLQKTIYADSILTTSPPDSSELKITLARLLSNVGRYDRAVEVRKSILKYDDTLPEDKRLSVMAELARDLINREDLVGAINVCKDIIQRHDSDSGLEEEMAACGVMQYVAMRTGHNDSHKYLDRGKALLEKARKANYSRREIDEMRRVMTRMELSELLSKNRFNDFFKLADSVMTQPMSNSDRLQMDLLWAYAHLINGEDDMAMEKYRRIMAKPTWNLRQGEALLNLTFLLIGQKKYDEALDLILTKSDLIDMLPKESYIYLSLQENRAIAMHALGDNKGAIPFFQDSFEGLSNLYYKTLVANGAETMANDTHIATLSSQSDERRRVVVWAMGIMLAMSVGGGIVFFVRLCRQRKELNYARQRIAELDRQHKDGVDATTNALQLARVNETIELIREVVRNKGISDTDKLKSISTALTAVASQTELWEIFKINFEQVHSGFFSRLYGRYPDLTPIEARMCAYLALNLSSKEIAGLTNRSLRSVESVRYRLNKKIDIPKDMTLVTYLRQFTASE